MVLRLLDTAFFAEKATPRYFRWERINIFVSCVVRSAVRRKSGLGWSWRQMCPYGICVVHTSPCGRWPRDMGWGTAGRTPWWHPFNDGCSLLARDVLCFCYYWCYFKCLKVRSCGLAFLALESIAGGGSLRRVCSYWYVREGFPRKPWRTSLSSSLLWGRDLR